MAKAKKSAVRSRSKLIQNVHNLAEELRSKLLKSLEGDVDAIHDARVATRRLKAVIDLFEGHLSDALKTRFCKTLRKIRRSLGAIRDIDVMIEHASHFSGLDAEAATFLRESLKRKRDEELTRIAAIDASKLLGKLGTWWGLREQIKDDLAKPLLRQSMALQLDRFCEHADRHSGRTASPTEQTPETTSELNPHDLRIAGKALRYTLEMAIEDDQKISANVMRTFKKMQDLLGTWHDNVVLTSKIFEISLEEELNYRNNSLLRGNLKLAQTTARRSEARLQEFFELWRKQGDQLRNEIRASIGVEAAQLVPPAVEAVSETPPAPENPETVPSADSSGSGEVIL